MGQRASLNGVTLIYRGHHICMVALNWAHGHQIPILSVNTCLHELLHALLHDIFESRPKNWTGNAREIRIDAALVAGRWVSRSRAGAPVCRADEAVSSRVFR